MTANNTKRYSFMWLMYFVGVTLCLHSSNIFAIDDLDLDPDLIALATGKAVPSAVAPATTTVVTRSEIKGYGYSSVAEILSHVPGFHIGNFGLSTGRVYSVRGFASLYTMLFMVNGDPYTSSFVGSVESGISRIPVEMIDRIEIQRGPGSAVYGSNATVGVVNIITRQGSVQNVIRVAGGNLDSRQITATGTTQYGGTIVNVGLDGYKTDGYESFVEADVQTILDQQNQLDPGASLAPYNLNFEDNTLGLTVEAINGDHRMMIRAGRTKDVDLGTGLLPVVDTQGQLNGSAYTFTYDYPIYVSSNQDWEGRFSIKRNTFELDNSRLFPPGAFGAFPDGVVTSQKVDETYFSLSAINTWSSGSQHLFRFEARAEHSTFAIDEYQANYSLTPQGLMPDFNGNNEREGIKSDRTDVSIRLNDTVRLSKTVNLTAGASADHYSELGTFVSPRVALVWNPSFNLTFKLITGQGIRSPQYLETVGFGAPQLEPNPDLEPEQLKSVDFVTEYKPNSKLTIRTNIFWHKTKDQINQTATVTGGFAPVNVGIQEGSGVELEAVYAFSDYTELRLWGHYQQNEGGFLPGSDNQEIGYSPHVKGGFQFTQNVGRFNYGLSYLYTGDRDRAPTDTKGQADKYGVVDLASSYIGAGDITYRLKILNLLDEEALEANFVASAPFDYEIPSRSIQVSIEKRFK